MLNFDSFSVASSKAFPSIPLPKTFDIKGDRSEKKKSACPTKGIRFKKALPKRPKLVVAAVTPTLKS